MASMKEDGGWITSELLNQTTPTSFGFIGLRYRTPATQPRQQTHIPSVHDHDTSHHNNAPMIHALLLFPMHSVFHVSHLYVFPSSLRLTWLADPALVTSVYPNRMQYTPCVLQEASLLDGVDAGVHGNGRRFSKTSSYPPCRRYAFILFYPYFLTTSLSPLFSLIHSFPITHFHPVTFTNHSHTPYCLCFLCLAENGNDFPLRHYNLVGYSSWPLYT